MLEVDAPRKKGTRFSMTDADCTAFLQWALPHLERRWAGYRKVRGIVRKRLGRRLRALGLPDLAAYRRWLALHPEEWNALDALLDIPISRFFRDRAVFESLASQVLPALAHAAGAEGRSALDGWSAGCASGEEAYTLAIVWRLRLQPAFPGLALRIVATDRDPVLLQRAHAACYGASSLEELPPALRVAAFDRHASRWCLRAEHRVVAFQRQDLREAMPGGPFDLVLCRNVVATYYAVQLQSTLFSRIAGRLRLGGALVLGIHESLPERVGGLVPWPGARAVLRKVAASPRPSSTGA